MADAQEDDNLLKHLKKLGVEDEDEAGIKGVVWLASEHGEVGTLRRKLESAEYTWSDEEKKRDLGKAMHLAVEGNHSDCVELLHEHGASIEEPNDVADTPLHAALRQQNRLMVRLLLKLNADITVDNGSGDAAIHVAARILDDRFIGMILEKETEINRRNTSRDSALHVAIHHSTGKSPNVGVVRRLVEKGANYLFLNGKTQTPAMLAIDGDNEPALQVMLDAGMDINIRWPDESNDTILHRCVRDNRLKCFLLLTERGANTNAENHVGETPLHILAKSRDHKLAAQTLLNHGAKVSILNHDKQTAYKLALKNKHWKVAELVKYEDDDTAEENKHREDENLDDISQNVPKTLPKEASLPIPPTPDLRKLGGVENEDMQVVKYTGGQKGITFNAPANVPRVNTKKKDKNFKKRNSRMKLCPGGSMVSLSDIEVEILAPPGAVKNKHGCNVQVKKWHFDKGDKVEDFTPASNVYELLPHGQVFEEDIVLKFPLELDTLYDAHSLNVLYSDTTAQQQATWQPIDKHPNDDSASCLFWEGNCYMNRHHFCEVFIKEEIRSDRAVIPLTALLFAKYDPGKNVVKLIVTCTGTDKKSKEIVEKKYGCEAVDDQPMLLYQQGKHLQFTLKYNSDVWASQTTQEILDKDLFCRKDITHLNDLHSTPHVTFYLTLKKSCDDVSKREISVVLSQKLSQKLGREVHKSYFALKWQYTNEIVTPSPQILFNLSGKSKTTTTSSSSPSMNSDIPYNIVSADSLPILKLNIVGTGLGGGVPEKPPTPLHFILDKDFRQFLKPVMQALNKDVNKLRELTASIGMVILGDNENKPNAQFILDAWNIRQKNLHPDNELQIWVEFLKVLKTHECTDAVELLILALEKQKLKLCVSHFMKYFKGCDIVCQSLLAKDLIFEDQYIDVKSCKSEFERVEFFIIKVLLKSGAETFDAFKQELVKTKQRELLTHFLSNHGHV